MLDYGRGVGSRVKIMDYDYGGGGLFKVKKEVIARVSAAIIQAQIVLSIF